MARHLSIEHQRVLNEVEQKAIRKYGVLWKQYLPMAQKRKINPVSTSVTKSNYRRRLYTTTDEVVNNLFEYAPSKTTYGKNHMFRKIDRNDGLVVLGAEGAVGGQIVGAPYMVHNNIVPNSDVNGWIEKALGASENVADMENVTIWSPAYQYGLCAIKIRVNEENEDWFGIDIEKEFLK